MINNILKHSQYAIPYTPPVYPSSVSSPPYSRKNNTVRHLLLPPTTSSATNYESWWSIVEVSLRQAFPVLAARLRNKLAVKIDGIDHDVFSDTLYLLETRSKTQEEKMSQSEKDVMKSKNDSLHEDNKLLKLDRVKAI